ncbi:MAG: cohesin domain-containing protein [Methanosarcinales archaeon]
MIKVQKLCFLIIAFFLITPIVFASEEAISIGNYSVDINSNITIPIEISNASDIAGGSVNLTYNSSLATVQSITSGDFGNPTYNIGSGYVKIAVSSASAIGKENATLANLTFKGIATGTTTLELKSAELNDANGSLITPKVINGSLTVYSLEPSVSIKINIDKTVYSPREVMQVNISVSNPKANLVKLECYLGVPQYKYWQLFTSFPVSSGDMVFTFPFQIDNWTTNSFGGVWYVHLLNYTSNEVLVQDTATWIFKPK